MNLHFSSFSSLALQATCFMVSGVKFTEGFTQMIWVLLVPWFDITIKDTNTCKQTNTNTHTDTGTSRLTHTKIPSVKCLQQPSVLYWIDNLLILKI